MYYICNSLRTEILSLFCRLVRNNSKSDGWVRWLAGWHLLAKKKEKKKFDIVKLLIGTVTSVGIVISALCR
jgi:hypothetical protein